jgi:hypothetical protein
VGRALVSYIHCFCMCSAPTCVAEKNMHLTDEYALWRSLATLFAQPTSKRGCTRTIRTMKSWSRCSLSTASSSIHIASCLTTAQLRVLHAIPAKIVHKQQSSPVNLLVWLKSHVGINFTEIRVAWIDHLSNQSTSLFYNTNTDVKAFIERLCQMMTRSNTTLPRFCFCNERTMQKHTCLELTSALVGSIANGQQCLWLVGHIIDTPITSQCEVDVAALPLQSYTPSESDRLQYMLRALESNDGTHLQTGKPISAKRLQLHSVCSHIVTPPLQIPIPPTFCLTPLTNTQVLFPVHVQRTSSMLRSFSVQVDLNNHKHGQTDCPPDCLMCVNVEYPAFHTKSHNSALPSRALPLCAVCLHLVGVMDWPITLIVQQLYEAIIRRRRMVTLRLSAILLRLATIVDNHATTKPKQYTGIDLCIELVLKVLSRGPSQTTCSCADHVAYLLFWQDWRQAVTLSGSCFVHPGDDQWLLPLLCETIEKLSICEQHTIVLSSGCVDVQDQSGWSSSNRMNADRLSPQERAMCVVWARRHDPAFTVDDTGGACFSKLLSYRYTYCWQRCSVALMLPATFTICYLVLCSFRSCGFHVVLDSCRPINEFLKVSRNLL